MKQPRSVEVSRLRSWPCLPSAAEPPRWQGISLAAQQVARLMSSDCRMPTCELIIRERAQRLPRTLNRTHRNRRRRMLMVSNRQNAVKTELCSWCVKLVSANPWRGFCCWTSRPCTKLEHVDWRCWIQVSEARIQLARFVFNRRAVARRSKFSTDAPGMCFNVLPRADAGSFHLLDFDDRTQTRAVAFSRL